MPTSLDWALRAGSLQSGAHDLDTHSLELVASPYCLKDRGIRPIDLGYRRPLTRAGEEIQMKALFEGQHVVLFRFGGMCKILAILRFGKLVIGVLGFLFFLRGILEIGIKLPWLDTVSQM